MTYGTLGMNALTEEMEVKGQLVAATRISTGFKSTMCKRDLQNPEPFCDQKKEVGMGINIGSCLGFRRWT